MNAPSFDSHFFGRNSPSRTTALVKAISQLELLQCAISGTSNSEKSMPAPRHIAASRNCKINPEIVGQTAVRNAPTDKDEAIKLKAEIDQAMNTLYSYPTNPPH